MNSLNSNAVIGNMYQFWQKIFLMNLSNIDKIGQKINKQSLYFQTHYYGKLLSYFPSESKQTSKQQVVKSQDAPQIK